MTPSPAFSCTLDRPALTDYVAAQMRAFFPDGELERAPLDAAVRAALERVEYCFLRNRMKCYWDANGPRFHHRHTDQYAVFLYYLSNSAHRAGAAPLAEKAYALNKALHGLDAFYEVELPAVFALQHPVGTVLGRASYADYFVAYQNVTVGADLNGGSPAFGPGVVLFGGAKILGSARIGANCFVSAGALILGTTVAPDSVVYGRHPDVVVKPTRRSVVRDIFRNAS